MRAFFAVVRLELRVFLADRLLAAGLMGFLACAVVALVSGSFAAGSLAASSQRTLAQERQLAHVQREILVARERAGEAPPTSFYDPSNPAAVGVFSGRHAVLPPSPWAALAIGHGDVTPGRVLVTTQSRWSLGDMTDTESPLLLVFGRLDLAFVFVVLFPLLMIAASYDLVSREREQGRLALLLAQPTTPMLVLGARSAARSLPLVAIGVAVSLVGFASLGPEARTAEGAYRAFVWCLLVTMYGLLWFAAAVLINVLRRGSAENALLLLAAWLAFIVVIPSTFDLGLAARHPLPSRAERALLGRAASQQAEARAEELVGGYYRDHPELVPAEGGPNLDFLPRYLAVTEQVDTAIAPVAQRFEAALLAQRTASDRLRFLSPALVLEWALCDVAGTGAQRAARFNAGLREYQESWRSFFLPLAFEKRRLSAEHIDAIPEFRFEDEAGVKVLARAGVALGVLSLSAAVLLLAALRLGTRLTPIDEA